MGNIIKRNIEKCTFIVIDITVTICRWRVVVINESIPIETYPVSGIVYTAALKLVVMGVQEEMEGGERRGGEGGRRRDGGEGNARGWGVGKDRG